MAKQQDKRSNTKEEREERKSNPKGKFNKNKNFPRNRKSNGNAQRSIAKAEGTTSSKGEFTHPLNDLSWYAKFPELLAAAAMQAFPYKPGMDLHLGQFETGLNTTTSVVVNKEVPGVMAINFDYSVGVSKDVTSPASVCAKELFSTIRRAFSGGLDEDAPDLFMYCLALDQIHAFIAAYKRAYRTVNAYSPQNYLFPQSVWDAEFGGADHHTWYEQARADKVKMWGNINTLVNMVNKFAVPDNMDIYKRHRFMNENVYLDVPSMMGQAYVFSTGKYYQINELSETGTSLIPVSLNNFISTVINNGGDFNTAMFQFGINLITALSNWDDAYTINGHIQRAYEGVPFYVAELIAQDEILEPVFVPEVLSQIHNLTVVDDYLPGDITQDPTTNAILHEPADYNYKGGRNYLMDLETMNPTPAEVTIASRLMAGWDSDSNFTCGTEVVNSLKMTYAEFNDDMTMTDRTWVFVPNMVTLYPETPTAAIPWKQYVQRIRSLASYQAWSKAPLLRVMLVAAGTGAVANGVDVPIFGEITNPTVMRGDTLANLNRVCLYSEFNCFNR